jgi:2-phosphosulfolactate phosphatase
MSQVCCEWGQNGVEAFRGRSAVLVIVDVLSFCTAVDVAVARGARVLPFAYGDDAAARAYAHRREALLAGRRGAPGAFSLSPGSLEALPSGARLVLPSPNGSALSAAAGEVPVLAGCLRNAAAVALAAREIAGDGQIAVIPAGERWPDGSLRPAIEDLLGAGAIIHHLDMPASPEAQVAREAYRSAAPRIGALIAGSVSGRELIDRGSPGDVDLACRLGASDAAPFLQAGEFGPFRPPGPPH